MVATALLLIVLFWAFALTGTENPWDELDTVTLRGALSASAAVVALAAAGVMVRVWWRHGSGSALWLGMATLAFGAAQLGVADQLDPIFPVGGNLSDAIEPATSVLVAALAVRAVLSPEFDVSDTLLRPATTALAGWLLLGAAFYALGRDMAWPSTVAWMLVSVFCLSIGLIRRRWLIGWFGVSATAVALHRIGELTSDGAAVALGSGVILVFGLLVLLLGAAEAVSAAYARESTQLVMRLENAVRRQQEERSRQDERAHEAQSALAVIDHAITTMDQRPKLEPGLLRTLQDAISTEVTVLRRLVTAGGDEPAPFLLSDGLVGAVTADRLYGSDIDVSLEAGLTAHGSVTATAEIVQALLGNARIHAPGSLVTIRGYRESDRVVLRVSDRGPGMTEPERLFGRGVQGGGTSASGEGLGLFIARRLASDQGGELSAEETPGGGASLVLSLPAAGSVDRSLHQVGEVLEENRLDTSISLEHGTSRF